MRFAVRLGLVGGIAAAAAALVTFGALADREPETFCGAYAAIVSPADVRLSHEDVVVLDHSYRPRDGCAGDDLWHYRSWDLEGIDGVLFDDCTISWAEGGRATAADVGIDCAT